MTRRKPGPYYVYRVFDAAGRLIYVGCTKDLNRRLRYHQYGYTAWWNSQAVKVRAKVFPTKAQALLAESAAIRDERPRWNISGKWCTNRDWTESDFADFVQALLNSPEFGEGTLRRARRVAEEFRRRAGKNLGVDWASAEQVLAQRQDVWSARLGQVPA